MAREIGNIIENPVYLKYLINIGAGRTTCYSYCKEQGISKGQFYTQVNLLLKENLLKSEIVKQKGKHTKRYYSVNFDELVSLFVDYVEDVKEQRLLVVEDIKDKEFLKSYKPLIDLDTHELKKSPLLKTYFKLGLLNVKLVLNYFDYSNNIAQKIFFNEFIVFLANDYNFSGLQTKDKSLNALINASGLLMFNPLTKDLFNTNLIEGIEDENLDNIKLELKKYTDIDPHDEPLLRKKDK